MTDSFHTKVALVFKALSLTRGQVAAHLQVDKSLVGRWVTGAARPSDHNLSRLTAMIAARTRRFTTLDWDRDLRGLAAVLGLDPADVPGAPVWTVPDGLPMPLLDQILTTTARRAEAYEGFFRTTRPLYQRPGAFIHDHVMIRRAPNGLLTFIQSTGGVVVEGWLMALQSQLFTVGAETTSNSLVFSIINGVNTPKAQTYEGLTVHASLDTGRTLIASVYIAERVGDLAGDTAADDARFRMLAAQPSLAPEGSLSAELRAHLTREIGPDALAAGGDWLLNLPLARSMSQGILPD